LITADNAALLHETLEEYITETEIERGKQEPLYEGTTQLKAMDISPEQQAQFITELKDKYGTQFTAEPRFI